MTHMRTYLKVLSAACFATVWSLPAFAQSDDEAQKQATRLISQAIADRLGRDVEMVAPSAQPMGMSTLWGLGSYTNLGFDGHNLADLYLATGGYDHKSGDTVFGVAGSYARTEFASSGFFGSNLGGADAFSISPYGALQFDPNFFLSGILSLSHTSIKGPDSTGLSTELAINGFTVSGPATFRGKLAYRGSVNIDPSSDLFSSFVAAGEVEVRTSELLSIYAGLEMVAPLDHDTGDVPFYPSVGLRFRVSDTSQLGVGYQTVFNAGDLELDTFLIQYRSKF